MQSISALFVFVFAASVLAKPNADVVLFDTNESVSKFIECFRKAIDGGLPDIDIPNYNPLKFADVTHSFNLANAFRFSIAFKNFKIDNIVDFKMMSLNATSHSKLNNYDYHVDFEKIEAFGEYELEFKFLFIDYKLKGSVSLKLKHLQFIGYLALIISPENQNSPQLDDFKAVATVSETKFELDGIRDDIDAVFNAIISKGLALIINKGSDILSAPISFIARKEILDKLLKKEVITAIATNCRKERIS